MGIEANQKDLSETRKRRRLVSGHTAVSPQHISRHPRCYEWDSSSQAGTSQAVSTRGRDGGVGWGTPGVWGPWRRQNPTSLDDGPAPSSRREGVKLAHRCRGACVGELSPGSSLPSQ